MFEPKILVASDTDFALMKGKRVIVSGTWDDVCEVVAYKHDALTTDIICLTIRMRDSTEWLVNEESLGWDEFLEIAELALSGIEPRRLWHPRIVQPAFARNETVVFKRSA